MILHPLYPISEHIAIPESMNNPFDYEPHPLCLRACQELQEYLGKREDWREEIDHGKMFGVLIVEASSDFKQDSDSEQDSSSDAKQGSSSDVQPQIGYLAAYSGQIGSRSDWEDFVPAVYDYLQPDGYFKTHEAEISHINQTIIRLENDPRMVTAKEQIAQLQKARKETIDNYQAQMKAAKAKRDARRMELQQLNGNPSLSDEERQAIEQEEQAMIKESQFMKAELRRLKKSLGEKTTLESEYADYLKNILHLKRLRKQLSDALQQWLFSQFRMLNPQGERKDLLEIFKDFAMGETSLSQGTKLSSLKMVPPAGSGECCEPKLLQYAYAHGLKPLQIAMFWWGESPKEEIRHHLHFYPACNGKCKPILSWMLPEIDKQQDRQKETSKQLDGRKETSKQLDGRKETSKQLDGRKETREIETVYEDDQIVVICKPAGMLSVPGKDTAALSVYSLMRKKYPHATGPLIVHRLDMATSGLMVIAKTEFAYRYLQKQFANHEVKKRYIAIIGCKHPQAMLAEFEQPERNFIRLPLMPDYLDRPRQIVSYEHGKEAVTEWEILNELSSSQLPDGTATAKGMHHYRIALYPQTGRTHQLRVHCAHQEGLNAPILGDPLYGNVKASRLYLHAEGIRFKHPLTGKEIHIIRKTDF